MLLFLFGILAMTPIYAKVGHIPFDEIVGDSDLIVVGQLSNVVKYRLGKNDYGCGVINIRRTLWGNAPAEGAVALQWHEGIICGSVSHAHAAGGTFIWLLKVDDDGYAHADYPTQRCPLSDEREILSYLENLTTMPKALVFPSPAATLAQPQREDFQQVLIRRIPAFLAALSVIGIASYVYRRARKLVALRKA